jgi:hypothetical protein
MYVCFSSPFVIGGFTDSSAGSVKAGAALSFIVVALVENGHEG